MTVGRLVRDMIDVADIVADAERVFETDTDDVSVVDPVDDLDTKELDEAVKDLLEVNEVIPLYDIIAVELCELIIDFVSDTLDDREYKDVADAIYVC